MTDQIIAFVENGVGRIRLNRPGAIHALTLEMCEAMTAVLLGWQDSAEVTAVILDHAEGRGFCAGGDIRLLQSSAREDAGTSGRRFFYREYQLNHLMFAYPKPIIAFLDGVTMGGGVGISLPVRYRIATENTRLAMPETGIGLFPDVGGGWYLSRLRHRIGQYMALTGGRLDGADCLATGLATHYVMADRLGALKDALVRLPGSAEEILKAHAATPPPSALLEQADLIEQCFASDRLEDIAAALDEDGSDWARQTLKAIRAKSPTSCKVALHQLKLGRKAESFADNMAMEYRIASRMLLLSDFSEGVRAVLIDKEHAPAWQPASAAQVGDDAIEQIFSPLPAAEEWKPL